MRNRTIFIQYGTGVLIGIAVLLCSLALPKTAIAIMLLLGIIGVLITSWLSGFKPSIFTLSIITIGINLLLAQPRALLVSNLEPAFTLLLFTIVSVVVAKIVERTKTPPEIEEYRKREAAYLMQVAKLQHAVKRAQTEVTARDEFLSVASHELRTPLTTMLLQIQTSLHNIRNVSLANFSIQNLITMLDSAEQTSRRLAKMINDLLNVSLITTGRMNLDKEDVDLTQTVKDVSTRFSGKLEKEGCTLTIESEKPIIGKWDKLRIEQVISNLLSNAIKYGKGKPIEVKLANSNGTGKIIVRDYGIGIPPDKQDQIFAKFKRAVSHQSYEGLGVGLYITQQIVTAHQGRIEVKSNPGEGSTFFVELPLQTPTA